MIHGNYIIIPLEVSGVVPYGIGSVKVERNGDMTIIAPSGHFFGRDVDQMFREGKITALRLEMVKKAVNCGKTDTTKDKEPCAFQEGHRFLGLMYCASLGDMHADEESTRLGEDK